MAGLACLWIGAAGCYEPLGDLCHPTDPSCADPCAARECGPAPGDAQRSCGECTGQRQVCSGQGQCVDDCADRACGPSPNLGSDCGACPGGQTCDAQGHCQAACPGGVCDDGSCPAAGVCCADTDDDERCGPSAICELGVCVEGPAGALLLDGNACTLAGQACFAGDFEQDGLVYTLVNPDLVFTDVIIRGGAVLTAPPVGPGGSGGRLVLQATGTVQVVSSGSISMTGRGWGGGGGGGGRQYCDSQADCVFGSGGETGDPDPNGGRGLAGDTNNCVNAGYLPSTVGSGAGGAGGGLGGIAGENGGGCPGRCPNPPIPLQTGHGGRGGGPFGGAGGVSAGFGNKCPEHVCCDAVAGNCISDQARPADQAAEAGQPGGYALMASNGDDSTDASVRIGSGGGGGAGGAASNGHCCGAADGGPGGVGGGAGNSGCTGGGGGGGGGAGGGGIEIRARNIVIGSRVEADGAGVAAVGGGFGAGGGILFYARQRFTNSGMDLSSLGGGGQGAGIPLNGGTVKIFYREFVGEMPAIVPAGRFYSSDLSE